MWKLQEGHESELSIVGRLSSGNGSVIIAGINGFQGLKLQGLDLDSVSNNQRALDDKFRV